MLISIRAAAAYELPAETFVLLMVEPAREAPDHLIKEEKLVTSPAPFSVLGKDVAGNLQRRLVAPAGEGGQGTVWRAEDPLHPDTPVALKLVPFNGAPLAVNSTMGGHTPIAFTALPPALGNIKDGSVRGIAILAKQRVASLPDLPTSGEEGVPGLESDTLTGIVVPAGTPQAIVDKWHDAIVKMAADPEIKKKLDALGFIAVANTPAEFSERIKTEAAKWDAVVKAAGIHME